MSRFTNVCLVLAVMVSISLTAAAQQRVWTETGEEVWGWTMSSPSSASAGRDR